MLEFIFPLKLFNVVVNCKDLQMCKDLVSFLLGKGFSGGTQLRHFVLGLNLETFLVVVSSQRYLGTSLIFTHS